MPEPRPPTRTVYQVSELAEIVRALVEDSLPRVWVQGELSNFSKPASGHWYFTLKDGRAQLRCAMFKNANFHIRPVPRDGDAVLLRAQLSVYTARGDLQLIVEHLEPAGEGALLRAFEELKRRLASEGLFDEHLKRELPRLPRAIGLITSGSGAALHDMRSTLARRYPLAPVYLYAVPVQGAEAPPAIVRALEQLPLRAPVDVILLARGGGSLEDLWAFNDERVARAIRACRVPVISGVGHEVDVTIADFAADLRAPTPTAAAERVAPDIAEFLLQLRRDENRLQLALRRRLQSLAQRSDEQQQRLLRQHPGRRLAERGQRLRELLQRLQRASQNLQRSRSTRLLQNLQQLRARAPALRLRQSQLQLQQQEQRLQAALQRRLERARLQLAQRDTQLASLNPRAVLQRGYAIALDEQGRSLSDARQVQAGAAIELLLARGRIRGRVESAESAESAESGPPQKDADR